MLTSLTARDFSLSSPRQLTPTIDKPLIEVRTEYLGLSPNEVERNITRRLEEQLESVEGLKKMTSRSQHGLSTITLEFDWGTDKKFSLSLYSICDNMSNRLHVSPAQRVRNKFAVEHYAGFVEYSTDNWF